LRNPAARQELSTSGERRQILPEAASQKLAVWMQEAHGPADRLLPILPLKMLLVVLKAKQTHGCYAFEGDVDSFEPARWAQYATYAENTGST
jgi:hypothetical protein